MAYSWFIDGVRWTGEVQTAEPYTGNPLSDPDLNEHTASLPQIICSVVLAQDKDCLILLDGAGYYRLPTTADMEYLLENGLTAEILIARLASRKIYLRGVGERSTIMLLGNQLISTLYENITMVALGGADYDVAINKCILASSLHYDDPVYGDTYYHYAYSLLLYGVVNSGYNQHPANIAYSQAIGTQAQTIYGAHLRAADLSQVSLEKVSYTEITGKTGWTDYECINTYAAKDVALDGTNGYGPENGAYRITYDEYEDEAVPTLTGLTISPSTSYMAPWRSVQLTVTGNYSDGTAVDVTASSAYASSSETIASVSSSGLVKSLSTGLTSITATMSGFTATALIVVQNVLPRTGSQIVAFAANSGAYRSMEYKTKRYKFKPASLSCIKVIADQYPVEVDVVYPSLKRAQSISVTSSKAQRIKSALVDCCEIVIRGNSQVSAVFLASSMDELPL